MSHFKDVKALAKSLIFSKPTLFDLYKKARSAETRARRALITKKYASLESNLAQSYTPERAINLARFRISARGINLTQKKSKPLRIFLFGANEAQDKTGFYQALQKNYDLVVFKNAIGQYGPEYDDEPFNKTLIERNDTALMTQIEVAHRAAPIDVLIGQMWANCMSASVLRKVQAMGIITLNISMDDRLPWHWGYTSGIRRGAIGLITGIDLTLTTSPECCSWYWCEGAPAIYFPLGSDPSLFSPAKKEIDVSFVGSKYGIRGMLIDHLEASGIKVNAFGPGWPNGHLESDQVADVFNKSKIILGIGTIGYNDDLFTMKLRDFDAPMAGALYITHRTPELQQLFKEDEEIAFYSDFREAAAKIKSFQAAPELLERIGSRARSKASKFYSWENRLVEAFEYIGIR